METEEIHNLIKNKLQVASPLDRLQKRVISSSNLFI